MTFRELIEKNTSLLKKLNRDDAAFSVKELVCSTFGVDRTWLIVNSEKNVDENKLDEFLEKIKKLASGYPLQYLVGEWSFYGNDFIVGEGVLIPRPESEELVDMVRSIYPPESEFVLFDLCSGSGCIGISIAKIYPKAKIYLFEKSDDAIKYIEKNIALNGVENVVLLKWDIIKEPYTQVSPDIIISNPPYIKSDVISTLQTEVHHEPLMALDGGEDGLIFYRAIANLWLGLLNDGGFAAVEHGDEQGEDVSNIFKSVLRDVKVIKDIFGNTRFVSGKK